MEIACKNDSFFDGKVWKLQSGSQKWHIGAKDMHTVFPQIVSEKCGNYSRVESICGNKVCMYL